MAPYTGEWQRFCKFCFLGCCNLNYYWLVPLLSATSLCRDCVWLFLPQPGFLSLLLPVCHLSPHTYYRECDLESTVAVFNNWMFSTIFLIVGLIPFSVLQTIRSILKLAPKILVLTVRPYCQPENYLSWISFCNRTALNMSYFILY